MSDEGVGRLSHAGARQREPDVRAAPRSVRGTGRATMRLRDQGDDREPEPAAARTSRLVCAAEALECAIEEAVGEAGPVVGHVQLDDVVTFDGEEVDGTPAV